MADPKSSTNFHDVSRPGAGLRQMTLESWFKPDPATGNNPVKPTGVTALPAKSTAASTSPTRETHGRHGTPAPEAPAPRQRAVTAEASVIPSENRFRTRTSSSRSELRAIAQETLHELSNILAKLPNVNARESEALTLSGLPLLQHADCPKHPKTAIRIVNDDSFNAAILLAAASPNAGRVAVLNMASYSSPGGGWLNGAMAQEEALCYRSSLALSLHKKYYPWKQRMGIYTPDVVIMRSDLSSGHGLLVPPAQPTDLPVVSVLSIAALRDPQVRTVNVPGSTNVKKMDIYAVPGDRRLTKDKMRICLRMAACRGHKLLVLAALGCGVFRNPPEDVAKCWLEVFQEAEFQGGWWQGVWFAVLDRRNEGNFEIFDRVLGSFLV
jgi:uncharacterized protein (TIGR02452 family)